MLYDRGEDYVIFEGLGGGAKGSSCSLISRLSSWDDVGDPWSFGGVALFDSSGGISRV